MRKQIEFSKTIARLDAPPVRGWKIYLPRRTGRNRSRNEEEEEKEEKDKERQRKAEGRQGLWEIRAPPGAVKGE